MSASISPRSAETKTLSHITICDELENPPTTRSVEQLSEEGPPSPEAQDSPLETTNTTAPCRVCFDLNLPHWSSKAECQAYRASATDQTGVDPYYTWGRLVISPRSLRAAAEAGCPSCGLLWAIWGRLPPDKYRYHAGVSSRGGGSCVDDVEDAEFRIHARKDRGSRSKVFTVEFQEDEYTHTPRYCFYRGLGDDNTSSLAKELSPLPWLASRPGPDDVRRFVEPRIAVCLSSHAQCNRSAAIRDSNTSHLPTRLIAVLDEKGCVINPTLVETASIPQALTSNIDTRYISLSHCWGSTRPQTTTRSNYQAHLLSIPWAALPKTFQDAVLATRALGVPFLWIDSLCIVQDDSQDWAREASKMASVYENAWLTLAATAAADGRQGLFTDRQGEEISRSQTPPVLLRPVVDHLEFVSYAEEKPSRALPLLWRGWGLQEQILSTRVLHFTREELLWECRSDMSCECSPRSLGLREIGKSLGAARSVWGKHPAETGANIRDWYRLVEVYMKRDLTYDSDRLPALSGIADAFQRTLTDSGTYLAGLWKNDLIKGLLWRVTSPRSRSPDQTYRTHLSSPPSWSWASTGQCPIYWPISSSRGRHVAEVIDVSCTRSTVDDKGMVSGGTLTIRGKLIPLKIQYVAGKEQESPYTTIPMGDRFWRSGRLAQDDSFMPDVQLGTPGRDLPPGSVLYFLPLINSPHWVSSTHNPGLLARGIFLRRLPETSTSGSESHGIPSRLFARVGCGALDFLAPTPGHLDPYARLGDYGDAIVTIV